MKKLLLIKRSVYLTSAIFVLSSCGAPEDESSVLENEKVIISEDIPLTESIAEPAIKEEDSLIDILEDSVNMITPPGDQEELKKKESFEKKGNAIIHKAKDQDIIDSIKAEKNKNK